MEQVKNIAGTNDIGPPSLVFINIYSCILLWILHLLIRSRLTLVDWSRISSSDSRKKSALMLKALNTSLLLYHIEPPATDKVKYGYVLNIRANHSGEWIYFAKLLSAASNLKRTTFSILWSCLRKSAAQRLSQTTQLNCCLLHVWMRITRTILKFSFIHIYI